MTSLSSQSSSLSSSLISSLSSYSLLHHQSLSFTLQLLLLRNNWVLYPWQYLLQLMSLQTNPSSLMFTADVCSMFHYLLPRDHWLMEYKLDNSTQAATNSDQFTQAILSSSNINNRPSALSLLEADKNVRVGDVVLYCGSEFIWLWLRLLLLCTIVQS